MGEVKHKLKGDYGDRPVDDGISSNIGHRSQNQDSVLVNSGKWGRLFAVADGMGGHSGGTIASRLACERLNVDFTNQRNYRENEDPGALSRRLVEAVFRADRFVRWRGHSQDSLSDMGTTLSCLLINGTHSIIAHVGDSRIYRLRKGHLSCLTVDHTFVQDMIFESEITLSQAGAHPLRHMLTRVVGTAEPLEFVDTRIDDLKTGDRFLLCTDGLHNTVNDNIICKALEGPSTATHIANGLVDRALKSGARDNVTAMVVCL